MLNNLIGKVAYNFDECELFINGKKFNLDWGFNLTCKIQRRSECTLKLYNSTPKIDNVIIKINKLTLFVGVPNEEVSDCYDLNTNQVTTIFTIKLIEQLSDGEINNESENIWKADTYLSNYFKTNYDFKLKNDMYFSTESIEDKLYAVVKDNKEPENYTLKDRSIYFGHAGSVEKITKIIDTIDNGIGLLTLVCFYNHNIFPSARVIINNKKEYEITEVQHHFNNEQVKNGYLMKVFGKIPDLLTKEEKQQSIDNNY